MHPSPTRLLEFLTGSSGDEAGRSLSAHVSRCPSCLARVRSLSIVLRASSGARLEPVPPALRREAVRIFDGWRRKRSEIERSADRAFPSLVRTALGKLRLRMGPSSLAAGRPAFAGLRSIAAPERCELEGGGYRVEIEWTASGKIFTIRGRMAPVSGRSDESPGPGLIFEFTDASPQRVIIGPRGFFGPVRVPAQRMRALLTTSRRNYRSRWLQME